MIPDIFSGPLVRDDEEGLFSRNVNGQLVRLDAPTESDYDKKITLQIDGQTVVVPMAEPLMDASGNIVVDLEGRTTPRYTTIYDAAVKLYVKQAGDEAKIPIPVLCHQPHMTPVAVCRLCVVQIYGQKRGQRAAERKLLPACQHQVKQGMEVFTMNDQGPDGERVRGSVKVLTELLAADHLKPALPPAPAEELAPFNELGQMAHRCSANIDRFKLDVLSDPAPAAPPRVGRRTVDSTSPVFLVDHTACILCERCVRACDEVMENNIIGRTGKGTNAGIGFDLNLPMGGSGCVQCGECMVSCPTTAITFKPVAQLKVTGSGRSASPLKAQELIADPLFASVPPKFLLWQQGLVVRKKVKAGELLCEQGDPGNTAFIIKSGKLEISVAEAAKKKSFFKVGRGKIVFRDELEPKDLIVGEMACLSGSPRSADVRAITDGEVWEVRRNVLDRLMRLPFLRERFERGYRERALSLVLHNTDLFRAIPDEEYVQISNYLREKLAFVRVKPGQILFRQGDIVNDMFLVRLGYIRVGVFRHGNEVRVLSRGPGSIVGEVGLMAFSQQDASKKLEEADSTLKAALDRAGDDILNAIPTGVRTATCSALGHLELARLGRKDFLVMIRQFPTLRRRLIQQSLAVLRSDSDRNPYLEQYVEQGLFEGQNILVIDMDRCTRCDECTRGCVHQHGTESHGVPVTRMIRDGRQFENYMVATSCRSCTNPHCMVGCPVDAIHRGKHLQIVIEDHCIGCGLCASNCPYGSIFMAPNERRRITVADLDEPSHTRVVAQRKATSCDLCDSHGDRQTPKPSCVDACPHDAAHRMSGEELFRNVIQRAPKR